MAHTYEQAIEALKTCVTLNDFEKLATETSASATNAAPNATYLLYSGQLDNGDKTVAVAKQTAENSVDENGLKTVIRIQDTELGKLLSDPAQTFERAYFRARQKDYIANRPGFNELSPAEQFDILKVDHNLAMGGRNESGQRVNNNSLWDKASELYVNQAKGDFRVILQDTSKTSVFYQTELPALLKNPNVMMIEGIPREELSALVKGDDLSVAFARVRDKAWTGSTMTGLSTNKQDEWLNLNKDTYKDPTAIERLKEGRKKLNPEQLASLNDTSKYMQGMAAKYMKIDPVLAENCFAYSFMSMSLDASAAYASRNKTRNNDQTHNSHNDRSKDKSAENRLEL